MKEINWNDHLRRVSSFKENQSEIIKGNFEDDLEKGEGKEGETRYYKDGLYKYEQGHWKKLKQEDIDKYYKEKEEKLDLFNKQREQDKISLTPDNKDIERAKSAKGKSEKEIASQAKAIGSLDKILRRGIAFAKEGVLYNNYFKERAKELGATDFLLKKYDNFIKEIGENVDYKFKPVYKESDYIIDKGRVRKPDEDAADVDSDEYREYMKKRIDEYNNSSTFFGSKRRERKGSYGEMVFPNYFSAQLWMDEFSGQISDGKYENSSLYERNIGIYTYRVKVDESLTEGYTSGGGIDGSIYFGDLLWLFDKSESGGSSKEERKFEVRGVGSKLPNSILRKYIDQATKTLKNKHFEG